MFQVQSHLSGKNTLETLDSEYVTRNQTCKVIFFSASNLLKEMCVKKYVCFSMMTSPGNHSNLKIFSIIYYVLLLSITFVPNFMILAMFLSRGMTAGNFDPRVRNVAFGKSWGIIFYLWDCDRLKETGDWTIFFFFCLFQGEKCSTVATLSIQDSADLLPVTDFKLKTSQKDTLNGSSFTTLDDRGGGASVVFFGLDVGPVCFQ